MNFEYTDHGQLIVDDAVFEPHYQPAGMVLRIGDEQFLYTPLPAYMMGGSPIKAELLKPYLARVYEGWTHLDNGDYRMFNLCPRGGYAPLTVGRAIAPEEWDVFIDKHDLMDDTISDPFEDTYGAYYGPVPNDISIKMTCRQVAISGNAIYAESELKERGIYAFSGSPGRLNIRVDPALAYNIPMPEVYVYPPENGEKRLKYYRYDQRDAAGRLINIKIFGDPGNLAVAFAAERGSEDLHPVSLDEARRIKDQYQCMEIKERTRQVFSIGLSDYRTDWPKERMD
jgi:hypothetical protein